MGKQDDKGQDDDKVTMTKADLASIMKQLADLSAAVAANKSAHVPATPAIELPPGAPSGAMMVRATRTGTYPNPGQVRHVVRNPGDVFMIAKPEHFADATSEHGWMITADQAYAPIPESSLPITTAPNLTQDPMGMPAGNPAKMVQSSLPL